MDVQSFSPYEYFLDVIRRYGWYIVGIIVVCVVGSSKIGEVVDARENVKSRERYRDARALARERQQAAYTERAKEARKSKSKVNTLRRAMNRSTDSSFPKRKDESNGRTGYNPLMGGSSSRGFKPSGAMRRRGQRKRGG